MLAKFLPHTKEKEKESFLPVYTPRPGEGSEANATPFKFPKKIEPHYVFVLDDSDSMTKIDKNESLTRWDLAKAALEGVVPIAAQSDPDGFDLYFINEADKASKGLKTKEQLEYALMRKALKTFTPIGERVNAIILEEYLPRYEAELEKGIVIKPLYLIIITDGRPNDAQQDLTIEVFKAVADWLDVKHAHPSQVGIQLIQIGNDKEATAFLKKLDDKIKKKKKKGQQQRRDIVDTMPYDSSQPFDEKFLWKVMNGATNPKVDEIEIKKKGLIRGILGL